MKHFSWALSLGACAAWILTSFCTSNTPKKITDIPVTTSSDSAKAAFEQGLKLVDQNDYLTSRPYFAKAIELDPKISPAYIFRIFTDFTLDERLADLKNAKDAIDTAKSSEWEILYTEFYSSFFKADYKSRLEIAKKIAALEAELDGLIEDSNGAKESAHTAAAVPRGSRAKKQIR